MLIADVLAIKKHISDINVTHSGLYFLFVRGDLILGVLKYWNFILKSHTIIAHTRTLQGYSITSLGRLVSIYQYFQSNFFNTSATIYVSVSNISESSEIFAYIVLKPLP